MRYVVIVAAILCRGMAWVETPDQQVVRLLRREDTPKRSRWPSNRLPKRSQRTARITRARPRA